MNIKGKKITIYDIASQTGLSIATVSRVLNGNAKVANKTRELVKKVIEKEGYSPRIHRKKIPNLGVLVFSKKYVFGGYSDLILDGANQFALENDCDITIHTFDVDLQTPPELLYTLRDRGLQGVMLLVPRNSEQVIRYFMKHKYPFVIVNDPVLKNTNCPHICVDEDNAFRKGIQHLINLGHKRICFLGATTCNASHKNRETIFIEEIKKARLEVNKDLLVWINDTYAGDHGMDVGYGLTLSLLQRKIDFSAIFAMSDELAAGAMCALNENKIVIGKDVSIIGFDDYPISRYLCPPLSTIKQPLLDIGYEAARMLHAAVECDSLWPSPIKQLKCQLILRNSCGPYKNNCETSTD